MKRSAVVLSALPAGTAGLMLPRKWAWTRSGFTLQQGLALARTDRHHDLDAIAQYHRRYAESPVQSVGERTWSDLDMDAVCAEADHCVSEPCRQYLYRVLHRTQATSAPLGRRMHFDHRGHPMNFSEPCSVSCDI